MKRSTFDLFHKPFQNINLLKIFQGVIKEESGTIIELQQDQLKGGKASDGGELDPPYRPLTIKKRGKLGLQTSHVDLKKTGAFYRQQFVKANTDNFEINSRSKKTPKLVDKYFSRTGGGVFGLTDNNKAILMSELKHILAQEFDYAIKKNIGK